jgi:DNA-directed RNA polymerase sigma subunit (sigma70/sigma32)
MKEELHSTTLCAAHLHVAHEEARRLKDDDALSECYMALVEAAASWDDNHGLTFERWARHLMRTRVRRRLMDKRVIRVPWRIRHQLADAMAELERTGKDVTDRSSREQATALVSASWAFRPAWIEHVRIDTGTEEQLWQEVPCGLSWVVALRYGYDGGGMRSAREVALLTGLTPERILQEEAEFLDGLSVAESSSG